MKKLIAGMAFGAALAVSTSASALTFTPGVGDLDPGTAVATFAVVGNIFSGPISANIGRSGLAAGTFTDFFNFTIPQTGVGSGSISTSVAGALLGSTDLDFLAVDFSNDGGMTWTVVPKSPVGGIEFAGLSNIPITTGVLNSLRVNYLSRGNGSYGGQLTFEPNRGVPEPATWALMMLGFGAIGFAMRRRSSANQTVRVRFAL